MRALILVDVQRDFLPGGALAVPEGDKIVGTIGRLASEFDVIVATADNHPEQTAHFEKWPVHCVAGTDGARLHPATNIAEAVFVKGENDRDDGYSGFEGRQVTALGAPTARMRGDDLATYLRNLDVDAVTVVGLALDFCVKATALDAAKLGFATEVPLAGTRAVFPDRQDESIRELRDAGVKVV